MATPVDTLYRYFGRRRWFRSLRARSRNRRALAAHAAEHPALDGFEPARDRGHDLAAAWRRYVETVSAPAAAISRQLAALFDHLIDTTRPAVVWDLGSGFSSFVARRYPGRVLSVDDDESWLARTRGFLVASDLRTDDLLTWDDFRDRAARGALPVPDLVLHDLGAPATRARTLPQVLDRCADHTLVLVDDVHKPAVRVAVLAALEDRRLACTDLSSQTLDDFGRYAWLVHGFGSARETA